VQPCAAAPAQGRWLASQLRGAGAACHVRRCALC
jgi:hypothetical protein